MASFCKILWYHYFFFFWETEVYTFAIWISAFSALWLGNFPSLSITMYSTVVSCIISKHCAAMIVWLTDFLSCPSSPLLVYFTTLLFYPLLDGIILNEADFLQDYSIAQFEKPSVAQSDNFQLHHHYISVFPFPLYFTHSCFQLWQLSFLKYHGNFSLQACLHPRVLLGSNGFCA